jgi:hypothetical protein
MKKILSLLLVFSAFLFSTEIWFTVDKSQLKSVEKIAGQFFPNAKTRFFLWEDGLTDMSSFIKRGIKPDVLLTGHTFVPYIANIDPSFKQVDPLFLDIRALYVWGTHSSLPVNRWRDLLFYIQNHPDFIALPKKWSPNNLYNFLSFFNDQLPFWISQIPFSPQNMVYTVKIMYKLMDNYNRVFKENPESSFFNKENSAIISGVWMYNLLKNQDTSFSLFDVPSSQNGVRGFKGAYVSIYFNNDNTTDAIKQILRSYNFQKETWEVLDLLPTNEQLQKELEQNKYLNKLYAIANSSPWVTAIEPKKIEYRTDVLNFLLNNKRKFEKMDESSLNRIFNNNLYFRLIKILN